MVIVQGRPTRGVGSRFSKEILPRIQYYQGPHPTWGAKTILSELIAQLPLKGIDFQDLVEPNFFGTLKSLQIEVPFHWNTLKILGMFH